MTRLWRPHIAVVSLKIIINKPGAQPMTKERRTQKEDKKKPAMTPKEKKAAKRSRKETKDFLDTDRTR